MLTLDVEVKLRAVAAANVSRPVDGFVSIPHFDVILDVILISYSYLVQYMLMYGLTSG
jgi:hypothetical protein